jgi:uncharacterized protein (DUF1501 family)
MAISRREFARLIAGASGLAVAAQLGNAASVAQVSTGFKAMVGVFLFGGNDAWNMVVPTDSRYSAYVAGRGSSIALQQSALMPLTGTAFGLHPSFAPLKTAWDEGGLNVMLNTGSLFQPLTKALYQSRPDLRPLNLMSHSDEQDHWQGMQMRQENTSGFMGRIADKMAAATMPPLISIAGSNLALIGDRASPLILPSTGSIVRSGYNAASTDNAVKARQAALGVFESGAGWGQPTDLTAQGISSAYAQAVQANTIVSAASSPVDQYFVNASGQALTSDIARQLQRTARMIAARDSLSHSKQVFFVSQGGYDTHNNQVNGGATAAGTQANLYSDLAFALAGFYAAMKGIGLADNVTAFTMSDFGRVYKANAQLGTDHAWGSNHLVVGGAVKAQTVHGAYPEPSLGGPDDIGSDGRWIPTIAIEEYVGAIANWWGVSSADMPYVFPNWSTWNGGGRGPVPLFG